MRLQSSLLGIIGKILRGKASQSEIRQFNNWYDSAHSDGLEIVDHRGRSKSDIEKEIFFKIRQRTTQIQKADTTKIRNSIKLSPVWIAASIFLFLSVGILLHQLVYEQKPDSTKSLSFLTFENGTGMFKKIKLPDGSTVQLYHNSQIQVAENFSENRYLKLSGEAFFDVRRDTIHPFRVESQNLVTEVLGTSFLIQNLENAQELVAVKSGLVKVSNQADTSFILEPNYLLDFSNGSGNVREIPENDPLFAWTEDVLVFENTDMSTMVSELEDWYGVTIEHNLSKQISCEISGTFKKQSLENLLELINYSIPITYQINGNHVSLHFKNCP